MRRRKRVPGSGRASGDRAAAMVEAVFVAPVVIGMILMIIDAGFLLFSDLTVSRAATDGARSAIVVRDRQDADALILRQILNSTVGLQRGRIERVVIYNATSPESDPPSACTTGPIVSSTANKCSVYGPAALTQTWDQLTCGWCPVDRQERDLVGVWIRMQYRSLTGIISTVTLTDQKVMRIEYDT
jgi:Flp pilus assembly protein TadG